MDFEILSWLGNLINFFIFLYLVIGIVARSCFDIYQISVSMFGMFVSIIIQAVVVYYRRVE